MRANSTELTAILLVCRTFNRFRQWHTDYRQHPRWRVLGFPPRSRDIHAALWKAAATPNFARRRIYDLRIALCLQSFGVTEFATANVKDFEGLGFAKIWNPVGNS